MSGPVRGMHDVEGKLFVVSGTQLYQINNRGVAIPRGTIPGTGRVSMGHNQITGGNQLLVVNGSSGYVYNTVTEAFTRVVDASYPGASIVEFIDGFLMQLEPFGRFLLFSDLADALAYNALDRFEAETAPDLTVGLAILHQEVWALGERTIDVFENTGAAQGTFRNKGVSISRGCGARWSTAVIDNGLAWLGNDGVVYHARGYDPVRISTRAIEVALSECSPADLKNAFAMVWEDRGHAVYYLTVPNGPTFGYDFSVGLWHRRATYDPVRDISGRWRLNELVRSNGRWIGGDYRTGKLYTLDWDYMMEGDTDPLVRERVSAPASNNQARFTVDEVELIFDTGGPETEPVAFPYQPVGPQISGNAPDALSADPYSFTYTTTPGTGAIVRTVLRDTTLPAGWSWNQLTATISHDDTPVPVGVIRLKMRVYDENGLFADHEDEFVIAMDSTLLVSGAGSSDEGPFYMAARALDPLEFDSLDPDTGADTSNGIPAFYGGTWVVARTSDIRYSVDDRATWQTGTISLSGPAGTRPVCVAGGPDGWVVSGTQFFSYFAISGPIPDEFVPHPNNGLKANEGLGTEVISDCVFRYVAGKWWAHSIGTGGSSGTWLTAETLVTETWTVVGGVRQYATYWYDICEWNGSLWATCRHDEYIDNARYQLKRSDDGGATWEPVILSDSTMRPWQLEAGDNCLLVLAYGGHSVWTSEDDFAQPRQTGIQTAMSATTVQTEQIGRLICYSAPKFYIVSGAFTDPSMQDRCVSTADGLTFSEPVQINLAAVAGIAAGATQAVEEPEDE